MKQQVSIIGSGIIGLAHALAFAKKGMKVSVYERHPSPIGASIRNFGLFWPIGQEAEYLPVVNKSKTIWTDLLNEIQAPVMRHGSLILAYSQAEMDLLRAFFNEEAALRPDLQLLQAREIGRNNVLVNQEHLVGGLKSNQEFTINPRKVIPLIIRLLQSKYNVQFYFNTPIQFTAGNYLASEYKSWESDITVICNGDDFETLYPEEIRAACLEKCHLQMMKATTMVFTQLGTVLCSGLSLLHYRSFANYPEINGVRSMATTHFAEYLDKGIHVILSQNGDGELIIGDSHAYKEHPSPFIDESINKLILSYLERMAVLTQLDISERWIGSYCLHPELKQYFAKVDENIWISTGFGGAGMTLGFGQADENADHIINSFKKNEKLQNYPVAF